MYIGFNAYLATMALACAQQEAHAGITNLHPLEHAETVVCRQEFVSEARKDWTQLAQGQPIVSVKELDHEFEAFFNTLDPDDIGFLAAAFRV